MSSPGSLCGDNLLWASPGLSFHEPSVSHEADAISRSSSSIWWTPLPHVNDWPMTSWMTLVWNANRSHCTGLVPLSPSWAVRADDLWLLPSVLSQCFKMPPGLCMVMRACNPRTRKTGPGRDLWVWGQTVLYNNFQAKSCIKKSAMASDGMD